MQVYLTAERKTIEVFNFVDVSPRGKRRYFRVEGTARLFISPGSEPDSPVKFKWDVTLSVRKITDYQHSPRVVERGWWFDSFNGTGLSIPTRRQVTVYERRPLRDEERQTIDDIVRSLGTWIQETYIRPRFDFREEVERRIRPQSSR